MTFNSKLESMIKENVLEKRGAPGDIIKLKEKQGNVDMTVEVGGLKGDVTVIRLGSHRGEMPHHPSLRKGWDICDYLLITSADNKVYAVFVELKTTLDERNKPYEQLRRSLPLLDYFLSAYKVEYGNAKKLKIKYALIGQRPQLRLDKQHVRVQSSVLDRKLYESIEVKRFLGPRVLIRDLVN